MFFFQYPLINDVTTTLESPPQFKAIARLEVHAGKNLEYPKDFIPVVKEAYPSLKPWATNLSAVQIFQMAYEIVAKTPSWQIVESDPTSLRIEWIATTRLMRFKDDVVLEVRPSQTGSVVHLRSRSRVGKGDLGANFKRIQDFLVQLQSSTAK